MTRFLDRYSIQARLFPALIVLLPASVLLAAFPHLLESWSSLWTLIVSCGGVYLLAQLGRDRGKRYEESLFESWGGKPTSVYMSFSGPFAVDRVRRIHAQIEDLFPDIQLPTQSEETENLSRAMQLYDEAVSRLRSLTRDAEEYDLVFKENCNYGFRRNLWGLKPFGIALSVGGLLCSGSFLAFPILRGEHASVFGLWGAGLVSGILFLVWTLRVEESWVRVPAEEYAKRLLETVTRLEA